MLYSCYAKDVEGIDIYFLSYPFSAQDAHEFSNFLLNELVDILEKEAQAAKSDPETSSPTGKTANGPKNGRLNGVRKEPLVTWVHKFSGDFCCPILSYIIILLKLIISIVQC